MSDSESLNKTEVLFESLHQELAWAEDNPEEDITDIEVYFENPEGFEMSESRSLIRDVEKLMEVAKGYSAYIEKYEHLIINSGICIDTSRPELIN